MSTAICKICERKLTGNTERELSDRLLSSGWCVLERQRKTSKRIRYVCMVCYDEIVRVGPHRQGPAQREEFPSLDLITFLQCRWLTFVGDDESGDVEIVYAPHQGPPVVVSGEGSVEALKVLQEKKVI